MNREGIVRECEHPGRPHSHGYECYRFDACRCRVGRQHHAADMRERRKRLALGTYTPHLIDKAGSVRRLQALAWLGYTATEIGEYAGISRYAINNYMRDRTKLIQAVHAQSIARLYEERWDKPAPPARGQRYVSAQARRRGYLPPAAWDDETIDDPNAMPAVAVGDDVVDVVAVKRALDGRTVKLTPAETDATIAAMIHRGDSNTMIRKSQIGAGRGRANRVRKEIAA